MPWTLTNDAGFLVQEGKGTYDGTPVAGLTLHQQIFPRAAGVGSSDILKLENGALRTATPEEIAAENTAEQARERGRVKQRLNGDKQVRALMRLMDRVNDESLTSIIQSVDAAFDGLKATINAQLAAGNKLNNANWNAAVVAFKDALRAGKRTREQLIDMWSDITSKLPDNEV